MVLYLKIILSIAIIIIIEVISKNQLSHILFDFLGEIKIKLARDSVVSSEQMKKEYKAFKSVQGYKGRLFDFFQDIISDLEYKDVTPQGLWVGILLLSSIVSAAFYLYTRNVLIMAIAFPIIISQIVSIMYLLSRLSHEQRVVAIMDALDLICPLIENNGVLRAIELSIDNIDPMIQGYFDEFMLHIKKQNYFFADAIDILNKQLGHVFNDFAKKAIIYTENPVEGSSDIFLDVIDSNADFRMVMELKRREFEKINFEFIGSFALICFFVVALMLLSESFKDFYLRTYLGRSLLISSISVVSIIFSILQYLQSQLDSRSRMANDKDYID